MSYMATPEKARSPITKRQLISDDSQEQSNSSPELHSFVDPLVEEAGRFNPIERLLAPLRKLVEQTMITHAQVNTILSGVGSGYVSKFTNFISERILKLKSYRTF